MMLSEVRKALKAIDPEVTVSSAYGGEGVCVKTSYNVVAVKNVMETAGYEKTGYDTEGPRWNTRAVILFAPKESK